MDWLARGTYPIVIGPPGEDIERLRKEGFPVQKHNLVDALGYISMGNGALALMNRAPHPNAARVYVNWIASKEGLETFSRAHFAASTRTDVDESFMPAERIPRPDIEYFDSNDWDYTLNLKRKIQRRLRELISSR